MNYLQNEKKLVVSMDIWRNKKLPKNHFYIEIVNKTAIY